MPVLIDKDATIPPFLRQFQALDASSPDKYQAGVRELGKLLKEAPLPSPDILLLQEYDRIAPKIIEQILELTEKEQLQQLELERQERQYFLSGKILGLLVLCASVAAGIVAYVLEGFNVIFFATIGAAIIGVLSSFLAGFTAARHSRGAGSLLRQRDAAYGD